MKRGKLLVVGVLLLLAILVALVPVALAKGKKADKTETTEEEQAEKTDKPSTTPPKETKDIAVIGEWPWIIPDYTYDHYNYGKILVSAYEYPDWEYCGKLHHLKVVPAHNNQTIKPAGHDINVDYDICRRTKIHGGPNPDHWYVRCPTEDLGCANVSFDSKLYHGLFDYKEEMEKPPVPEPPFDGHYGDTLIECDYDTLCDTIVYCDTFDVGIAEFPMERELLLVVTVDNEKLDLSKAKIRWSFMDPTGDKYCNYKEKGVPVSIIKGAGVAEGAAQLSDDQIITTFGDGPVYPMLPQTVDYLCDCSGAPVDKIDIYKNQSWVIVRGFEPGISKVFVNLVHEQNYNFPEMEYAVRWTRPLPPVHPDFDLRINITEDKPDQNDPYIFNDQVDQLVKWKITVNDETDYYVNPTDPGILPIIYQVDYDLRFRRDPIQWDSPKNWDDAYALFLDTEVPDPDEWHMNRLIWETSHKRAMHGADPVLCSYSQCTDTPGAVFEHNAYTMFKAHESTHGCVMNPRWGEDHYWQAKQKAVDLSIKYIDCEYNRCRTKWNHITDESITLEYQPGDADQISGLEVEFIGGATVNEVHLTNTGAGNVYEIYLEKANGRKGAITHVLHGGDDITVWYAYTVDGPIVIEKGDWIWYYVYSTSNMPPAGPPVVAQQKRVRVQ